MLSAAKHPAAGWGSRMASMCVAVAGLAMAVLAFLPWFDFRSFSVSGIDLPGLDGEIFFASSVTIVGTGVAAVFRHRTVLLFAAFLSGIVAFAASANQTLADWYAGPCFGTVPGDDLICTVDYSKIGRDMFLFITGDAVGSPTAVLWSSTGLSAFVSLLAGWRLLARPAPSEPETPTEVSEAWS